MEHLWVWLAGGGVAVLGLVAGIWRFATASLARDEFKVLILEWEKAHEARLAEMIALAVQTGMSPLRETVMRHESDENAHPLMVRGWERHRDDRLHEVLKNLHETIRLTVLQAANEALKLHDENPRAHALAVEHNHKPIVEKLERIERDLSRLRNAHNLVAETGKHKVVKDENE